MHSIYIKYRSLWQLIAYAMLVVIFIASLLPTEHLPKEGNDKIQHLVSYGVLAMWFMLAFSPLSKQQQLLLMFKLVLFGAIIEILQGLSGYRYAEWYDLLANSIGILIGYFVGLKLVTFIVKLKKP